MTSDGAFSAEKYAEFEGTDSRAMPETALITQKNQPHAARTTALLLSRHPLLPFLTSPQPVRKTSLADDAERRDARLAVIGRQLSIWARKDHARAV
ncbi:hypothetical protein, partial [Erythrobacter sp. HI0074]|uniref:hypothetical protein n=1 Tax=Erythrobacter sp. HI0074 TaxID=1822249 RepID=UPI001F2B30AD